LKDPFFTQQQRKTHRRKLKSGSKEGVEEAGAGAGARG
jgi:hypothetical protein